MTARTVSDYAGALRGLLPRGRVWPQDPETDQQRLVHALANEPQRLDAAAVGLLAGSLPGDNAALLLEWEESLGLPDPCVGPNPSQAERAKQVRARFIGSNGQSASFFVAFAAALGFTIEIETYAPFRIGLGAIGDALASDAWCYAWGVRVIANAGGIAPSALLCELQALKPAHTTVFLTE